MADRSPGFSFIHRTAFQAAAESDRARSCQAPVRLFEIIRVACESDDRRMDLSEAGMCLPSATRTQSCRYQLAPGWRAPPAREAHVVDEAHSIAVQQQDGVLDRCGRLQPT
jgi:hypothetical protein